MSAPRKSVLWFADKMERKLSENDISKSDWRAESSRFLLGRILGEVHELQEALSDGSPEDVILECADVANIAMMIADNHKDIPLGRK